MPLQFRPPAQPVAQTSAQPVAQTSGLASGSALGAKNTGQNTEDNTVQQTLPIVLTIAGSDSSGGAGIQADLKTFSALGIYGASVITALTAQNTCGVVGIQMVDPGFVSLQFQAVLADLKPAVIKVGMLGNAGVVSAVAECLKSSNSSQSADVGGSQRIPIPLIVDPVMVATSGDRLLDASATDLIISDLLPLADLITPNLPEAAVLLGPTEVATSGDMERQVRALHDLGARAVLLKGGHGEGDHALDLFYDGDRLVEFSLPWVATGNTHGTGCTLSSAIASFLAHGLDLECAIFKAKQYVWDALSHGRHLQIGRGTGPVNHLCRQKK